MKNPVRNGVIGLLVAAAVSGSLPTPTFGQPGGQPGKAIQPGSDPLRQPGGARPQYGPTISVSFPGGTLDDYIRALQQAAGEEPVNVVTPAVAKRVELPPITLRGVTTYTALAAVRAAFEENSEHQFNVRAVGAGEDATFSLEYMRINPNPEQPASPFRDSRRKDLQVYSIRDLIEPAMDGGAAASKVAYEDILAAVEAAMKLLDVEEAPRMMFHKETGLLMVGGTPDQTAVVDTLIKRVREDMQRRWSEERSGRKASAERTRRLTLMRNEVRLAELELVQAEERLKRVQQRVDGGLEPKDMLSQAGLEWERAKANLERRQLELQSVEEEADAGQVTSLVMYDVSDIVTSSSEALRGLQAQLKQVEGARLIWRDNAHSLAVEATASQQKQVEELIENFRRTLPAKSGGK